MALASTIYLSLLGKQGLAQLSQLCYQKAHYAAEQISKLDGFELVYPNQPFFNEFLIRCPKPVSMINLAIEEHFIIGGYDVSKDYPEMKNCMLVAITEKISKGIILRFCMR